MAKFKGPCTVLVQMEGIEPVRCEGVVEAGSEADNYVVICADDTWFAFKVDRLLFIKSDGVVEEES